MEIISGSISDHENNYFWDVDRKNELPYRLRSQATSSARIMITEIQLKMVMTALNNQEESDEAKVAKMHSFWFWNNRKVLLSVKK